MAGWEVFGIYYHPFGGKFFPRRRFIAGLRKDFDVGTANYYETVQWPHFNGLHKGAFVDRPTLDAWAKLEGATPK